MNPDNDWTDYDLELSPTFTENTPAFCVKDTSYFSRIKMQMETSNWVKKYVRNSSIRLCNLDLWPCNPQHRLQLHVWSSWDTRGSCLRILLKNTECPTDRAERLKTSNRSNQAIVCDFVFDRICSPSLTVCDRKIYPHGTWEVVLHGKKTRLWLKWWHH